MKAKINPLIVLIAGLLLSTTSGLLAQSNVSSTSIVGRTLYAPISGMEFFFNPDSEQAWVRRANPSTGVLQGYPLENVEVEHIATLPQSSAGEYDGPCAAGAFKRPPGCFAPSYGWIVTGELRGKKLKLNFVRSLLQQGTNSDYTLSVSDEEDSQTYYNAVNCFWGKPSGVVVQDVLGEMFGSQPVASVVKMNGGKHSATCKSCNSELTCAGCAARQEKFDRAQENREAGKDSNNPR